MTAAAGCCVSESVGLFHLKILGPFRLLSSAGERVDISSKKGQALIAMLALAGGGERTRSWLQDKLWGSRQQAQAQASLRNELGALRAALNTADVIVLHADHLRVWLDLSLLHVDAREMDDPANGEADLLEGLDIAGEEAFEDWFREERARIVNLTKRLREVPANASATPSLPVLPTAQFAKLPALAVLRFANLTNDPGQDIFAEGISEDLIDRLSRLRWLPIIARSSSFAVSSADIDSKEVGEQLGARYLLEGRLRKLGDGLSLTAELSDTHSGQIVWSNKLRVEGDSQTGLEDMLSGLTSTLGAKIDQQQQSLALRKPQSDLNVRELIWRGRWHLNRFTREDAAQAKTCFAEALRQEPNSPEAIIQMTNSILWDAWALRGSIEDVRIVRQMAQKAIIADYDDARGHMMAGIAECFLRQPIRAKALLERSIDLNPSLFLAHGYLGSTHYLSDNPKDAISALEMAVQVSPNDQHLFHILGELAISHLMLGDHATAIEYADNATLRRSAYWFAHVIKVNALGKSGDVDAARLALAELQAANPNFTSAYVDWVPFCDSKWNDFLKKGLNLSGQ